MSTRPELGDTWTWTIPPQWNSGLERHVETSRWLMGVLRYCLQSTGALRQDTNTVPHCVSRLRCDLPDGQQ